MTPVRAACAISTRCNTVRNVCLQTSWVVGHSAHAVAYVSPVSATMQAGSKPSFLESWQSARRVRADRLAAVQITGNQKQGWTPTLASSYTGVSLPPLQPSGSRGRQHLPCQAGALGPSAGFSSGAAGALQGFGNFAINAAAFGFCAYLALCAFVYGIQRKLQYFPDPRPAPPPSSLPLEYQDLSNFHIDTADGVSIQGYFWPPPAGSSVVVLLLHGNAGSRLHRVELMRMLREGLGVGVCAPDYRGYGGSQGSPTEEGLVLDAAAAADWVYNSTSNDTQLVILGESIGAAVGLAVVSEEHLRRPAAGLILQSAFSSAVDVGASSYPFLPVRLLMKDRFENIKRAAQLPNNLPVCCVHGDEDTICPVSMGRALFHALPSARKSWRCIHGAGHNDLPYQFTGQYLTILADFLKQEIHPATIVSSTSTDMVS